MLSQPWTGMARVRAPRIWSKLAMTPSAGRRSAMSWRACSSLILQSRSSGMERWSAIWLSAFVPRMAGCAPGLVTMPTSSTSRWRRARSSARL